MPTNIGIAIRFIYHILRPSYQYIFATAQENCAVMVKNP